MQHAHLVKPLAAQIARRLPPCFELADLVQTGNLALHCALAARDPLLPDVAVQWYLKRRIRGAILDSIKGPPYREAMHAPISAAVLETPAPAAERSPEAQIDLARQVAATHAAISALPPDERAVMELRNLGLTQADAAEMLGVSQVTVSNRERAAIRRIRLAVTRATRGDDKAA